MMYRIRYIDDIVVPTEIYGEYSQYAGWFRCCMSVTDDVGYTKAVCMIIEDRGGISISRW